MTQIFALNGQTITNMMEANWEENPVANPLAGGTVFNRVRLHRWQTNVLTAAEFETILGRLGQAVSLTTTDYTNPNGDYVTYYGATLDTLAGEHSGPVYVGVTAEFRVRV